MTDQPLIVVSLEGLATAGLSCYGSPWNSTPAIDALAATGCVWDRWVATDDQPLSVFQQWIAAGENSGLARWREAGRTVLHTDDPLLIDQISADSFDEAALLDSPSLQTRGKVAEIEDTQWGRLIASAIERDAAGPWSVLWIHSRFLSQCWDAPRELFPSEEEAWDEPPEDDFPDPQLPDSAAAVTDAELPPPIFDSVTPPHFKLDDRDHPDLITSWMRTYGCQIRLVDLLLEVLLQSIRVEDPLVVLAGTSGFSLGQNGWIGHAAGPLRSWDLRLPMVVSDCGPIRSPHNTPSDSLGQILANLALRPGQAITPSHWCRAEDEFDARIVTQSQRAQAAITSAGWFYVRDQDSSEHLFLKPDDVDDTNDVGRLRRDVIERLTES
ncbi:MAG: hypothetical protein MI861_28390 [Pirellulales bacterium]|nr:hypothetical protein [Pirellulales bacterium]